MTFTNAVDLVLKLRKVIHWLPEIRFKSDRNKMNKIEVWMITFNPFLHVKLSVNIDFMLYISPVFIENWKTDPFESDVFTGHNTASSDTFFFKISDGLILSELRQWPRNKNIINLYAMILDIYVKWEPKCNVCLLVDNWISWHDQI